MTKSVETNDNESIENQELAQIRVAKFQGFLEGRLLDLTTVEL